MLPARDGTKSDFQLSGRGSAAFLLGLLSISQVVLFAGGFRFFFQGDSLYWLAERYTDWADMANGFLAVDSYGYFRPLSHPLPAALLHPLFGLNPTGYDAVALAILIVTTWLLYLFLRRLSGSGSAAFLGAFYFGVHSSHVFVTFGLAFAPELLYGLFYLLSAWCFVGSRRDGVQPRPALSCLFFALSLLSKESAVTLPANLFALAWFLGDDRRPWPRLAASWRAVAPHLAVLGGYFVGLAFFVRGGRQLLGSASGVLDLAGRAETAVDNLGLAFLWGFNLPGAWSGAWRNLPAALEAFLLALGLATLASLAGVLLRPNRGKLLIPLGFLWFVIALSPTLTLTEFKPYYLYVPLFGLSMAVGRTVLSLREAVPRRFASGGDFALVLALTMLWQCSHLIVGQDLRRHPLLGPAAEDARQAAELVKGLRPDPPRGSTILVLDGPGEPLWWRYAQGRLFELVFNDPSIEVLFASLGQLPAPGVSESPGFLAVKKLPGGLVDVTREFRESPGDLLDGDVAFTETVPNLIEVTPGEVVAGEGRYVLRVRGWADREVEIQIRRDGGPTGSFRARLDSVGAVTFFVSLDTPSGRYEFPAVRTPDTPGWVRSEPPASLTVR